MYLPCHGFWSPKHEQIFGSMHKRLFPSQSVLGQLYMWLPSCLRNSKKPLGAMLTLFLSPKKVNVIRDYRCCWKGCQMNLGSLLLNIYESLRIRGEDGVLWWSQRAHWQKAKGSTSKAVLKEQSRRRTNKRDFIPSTVWVKEKHIITSHGWFPPLHCFSSWMEASRVNQMFHK